MAKVPKGAKVAITGGRDASRVGRVTKQSDITTSRYEVEVAGRSRKARPTKKQMARLAEPKPTFWAWLWTRKP